MRDLFGANISTSVGALMTSVQIINTRGELAVHLIRNDMDVSLPAAYF